MITVYTALVGNIDGPRTDIKCFTGASCFKRPRWSAKTYKILGHLWVSADVTIWVDANIYLKVPAEEVARVFIPDGEEVGCFRHPYRKTVLEEVYEIVKDKKESEARMAQFEKHQKKYLGMELCECGVLVRRRTDRVALFNCIWWALVCRWSVRDQITFPLAVDQSGVRVNRVDGNVRDHELFTYVKHERG